MPEEAFLAIPARKIRNCLRFDHAIRRIARFSTSTIEHVRSCVLWPKVQPLIRKYVWRFVESYQHLKHEVYSIDSGTSGRGYLLHRLNLARPARGCDFLSRSRMNHSEPGRLQNGFGPTKDYSTSAPVIFFLCFRGLRRLSGMVRSDGGMPKPRRAKRRASLWIRIRSRFFFAMRSISKTTTSSNQTFRKHRSRTFAAVTLREPLAPDAN